MGRKDDGLHMPVVRPEIEEPKEPVPPVKTQVRSPVLLSIDELRNRYNEKLMRSLDSGKRYSAGGR